VKRTVFCLFMTNWDFVVSLADLLRCLCVQNSVKLGLLRILKKENNDIPGEFLCVVVVKIGCASDYVSWIRNRSHSYVSIISISATV
jgi:hypothetical protein